MRAVLALAGFITITFVAGFNEDANSLQIGPEEGEVWADQVNARVVRRAADKRKIKTVKKPTKNGKKKGNKKNHDQKKRNKKIHSKKNSQKKLKRRNRKKLNRIKGQKHQSKKSHKKKASKKVKEKQCSSQQADDTCLQNAKDVLTWEGVQVMNFMKQYIRYNNFRNTANNKMGKRFKFDKPMGHMENATGGKDKMTNMTCANNTGTSRNNASYDAAMFMETYHTLIDCNATVAAACSIKESTKVDAMAECNTDMKKVKDRTKECINATQNHCTCWNTVATTLMEPIKAKKCNTEMTKMIKEMKTAKGACIKAFAKCKQAEDMTSGLVLNCMEFNENDDWNKPEPVKVLPSG